MDTAHLPPSGDDAIVTVSRDADARRVADALGVNDLLVVERDADGLRLIGGVGRGAGWAGTVQTRLTDEPLAARALTNGRPVHVNEAEPVRIFGPYWASHAALVPVGDDHLAIAGAAEAIRMADGELLRHAAEAVAAVDGVSPAKLLADELEVVHAVRQLMEHRATSVAEMARHVAEVAGDALGCEFAAVLVKAPFGQVVETAGGGGECSDPRFCMELNRMARRAASGPVLDQEVDDEGLLGAGAGLVARYTLGIGNEEQLGVLVVGHAAERPRGFTELCQRVGRALADAAEVLLSQAVIREQLTAERDEFARIARTDPLTGVPNRVAWQEALAAEQQRRARYRRPTVVMSVDVDRLKETNDRFGHDAGDELLAAAAGVLRAVLRDTDILARVGGDEFCVLMPETDATVMPSILARITDQCDAWRGSRPDLRLSVSVGWAAPDTFGDLREALRTADERMYASRLPR
jgi:diguanylate cyclase (GGDEF)-like protein